MDSRRWNEFDVIDDDDIHQLDLKTEEGIEVASDPIYTKVSMSHLHTPTCTYPCNTGSPSCIFTRQLRRSKMDDRTSSDEVWRLKKAVGFSFCARTYASITSAGSFADTSNCWR